MIYVVKNVLFSIMRVLWLLLTIPNRNPVHVYSGFLMWLWNGPYVRERVSSIFYNYLKVVFTYFFIIDCLILFSPCNFVFLIWCLINLFPLLQSISGSCVYPFIGLCVFSWSQSIIFFVISLIFFLDIKKESINKGCYYYNFVLSLWRYFIPWSYDWFLMFF